MASSPQEIIQWLEQALVEERESATLQLECRHQRILLDFSKHLSSVGVITGDISPSQSFSNEGAVTEQQVGAGRGVPSCNAEEENKDAKPATATVFPNKFVSVHSEGRPGTPVFASHRTSSVEIPPTLYDKYVKLISSTAFEAIFAVAFVCGAIIVGVEMQYRGLETGHRIGYPSYTTPAAELWPRASNTLGVAEWVIGVFFIVELLLKLIAQRVQFFCKIWNWIDMLILSSWIGHQRGFRGFNVNPLVFRLLRLSRLLRLKRLLSMTSAFDSLYMMVTAIKGSLMFLLWAVLLICVVEVMLACLLQASVEHYLLEGNRSQKAADQVYMHFGSLSRSMLSMFELTLGNWIPPTRALVENVSEWYLLFFLMHKFIIGLSVVSVITGVFIQETFKVATTDDLIMLNAKKRAMEDHAKKMSKLFRHADRDGDGSLDRKEFDKEMDDPVVRKWLSSMGLEVDDVDTLFETLSSGDGKVTSKELVAGAGRLKGNARSIDLLTFITEYRHDHSVIMEHLRRQQQQQQQQRPQSVFATTLRVDI